MGAVCCACEKRLVPPKPTCPNCRSKNLEWKELPKTGRLLTYTVIHVSPKQFEEKTPYAVGIVELEKDAQLPGIIRNTPLNQIRINMQLNVGFAKRQKSSEWPRWSRYYFTQPRSEDEPEA